MKDKGLRRLVWFSLFGAFVATVLRTLFGRGDALISGVGNSGNRIYTNDTVTELAAALAASAETPAVADEWLEAAFEALVEKAKKGDLEAALLLLKLAEQQRR